MSLLLLDAAVVASVSPSCEVDVDADAGQRVNGRWTNAGSTGTAVCVNAARRSLVESILDEVDAG